MRRSELKDTFGPRRSPRNQPIRRTRTFFKASRSLHCALWGLADRSWQRRFNQLELVGLNISVTSGRKRTEDELEHVASFRPAAVIGPLGEPLTHENLPSPNTQRWVVRRKAEVVAAVNGGLLTVDEACTRYDLTLEEFVSWQRAVDRSGLPGLRVTQVQRYRELYQRQLKY